VFYARNGAAASPTSGWVNITGNLPVPSTNPMTNTFVSANPWISGAVVNPNNPSEAWVTIGGINVVGGVYHTLNAAASGGTKWNQVSGVAPPSVPNVPVNGIALDPTTSTPSAVYVATDTGVMVCNPCTGSAADTSATWNAVGTGLPNVKVSAITFSRDQRSLIAWTHGLGAWSISTSGWDRLGGQLASRPVSPSPGTSRLDSFVLGTDNLVWHSWWDGAAWQWEPLSGSVTSDPAVAVMASGSMEAFARGTDGSLLRNRWTAGTWTGWVSLGGKLAAAPAAVDAGGGQVVAFVQGTDSRLWYWSSTSGWQAPGGVLAAGPSATVATTASEFDAFVQGTDKQLWYWSSLDGWHLAGGVLADKPAATSWGGGRLDAFVEGTDLALWHWSKQAGWDLVGGRLANRPAAVSWASPRLDAFVQGTDNGLWHAFSTGTGWQWEQLLGAVLSKDPAAMVFGAGRTDVFMRSSDLSLWHRPLP
jgi:hypothetical protein